MNTQTLNKEVQKIKEELIVAVNIVLVRQTHAELLREKVDAVYREILAEIPTYVDPKFKREPNTRILENKDLWLAGEEAWTKVYAEGNKRLLEQGIKPADMDSEFCPALVAEHEFSKAKHLLIETASPATQITLDMVSGSLESYRKLIDLLIGLIISLPEYKQPVLK